MRAHRRPLPQLPTLEVLTARLAAAAAAGDLDADYARELTAAAVAGMDQTLARSLDLLRDVGVDVLGTDYDAAPKAA